jgi:twitching motility protein PilT
VTAAETGHLVFGTIHTVSADTSIDRLTNAFPAAQQEQVRSMLSESLRSVVCQYLLRRKDIPGRQLALEIMINTDAVSAMIRKGKTYQIPSVVATSREIGMQSMDADLLRLVKEGKVWAEEAYMKARSKKDFESFLATAVEGASASPSAPGGAPQAPPPTGGTPHKAA